MFLLRNDAVGQVYLNKQDSVSIRSAQDRHASPRQRMGAENPKVVTAKTEEARAMIEFARPPKGSYMGNQSILAP